MSTGIQGETFTYTLTMGVNCGSRNPKDLYLEKLVLVGSQDKLIRSILRNTINTSVTTNHPV